MRYSLCSFLRRMNDFSTAAVRRSELSGFSQGSNLHFLIPLSVFHKGELMEPKFYEARPYIYICLAFYALAISHNSKLMISSGVLLFLTGVWVLKI
jgi:hypothetical protein